jgi:hypothetical protein
VIAKRCKLSALTLRVRAEYEETPGLRLTVAQAARFWCLDERKCEQVLDQLKAAGFLRRCPDGSYRQTALGDR